MAAIPEGLTAALSDRYRLERELGAGGMATVYLAEDLKHHRQVAIKVLRPDLAASLGAERFLREVGIAARLSHPHILGLFDSGEAGGFLYYVMPYVEGISLRQKLQREGELPIPEAVRILRDIADALAHAHRQGVVHRDIKPENVMLVERHALVMDFGVAKALAEGQRPEGGGPRDPAAALTSVGVALGTPAYMAPEQASGEGNVDARADLYAWGIVAYELLAGQPPFIRATPQNTLAAQVTATPEPVTQHRANVPGLLAHLVMQCLEKKAADRLQSAEELLRQLDQVLTPSGGMTPTDTRPYQTAASRRARRRTLFTGAAMVAGLAVIGVLGWRWWQSRGVPIVADRVLVAPLEAEGAAFEGLAQDLAALTTAMTREGIGSPVPAATVRDLGARRGGDPAARAEYLGKRTGAGYVLRTSCAPQESGATCQLELLQRPGNRLRMAVPVRDTALDGGFSARVQEQALAMLLLELYWGDQTTWLGEYIPSSLEAVRAFHRSFEDPFSGGARERAARADTNWIVPYSDWVGSRSDFTGAQQDSALAALARRPGLTERDLLVIEAILGANSGDPDRLFEMVGRLYRGWPSNWHVWYLKTSVDTHRPQAALDAISADSSHSVRSPRTRFEDYLWQKFALHHLGRYQEQLQLAATLREAPPQAWADMMGPQESQAAIWQDLQIQGYAGLGQVDSVRRVVAELGKRSRRAGAWLSSEQTEDLGLYGALELMTHGHAAEGEAMLASSLPALQRLREEELAAGTVPTMMENEVWTLEWTGELDQARALAEQILREQLIGHIPEMMGSLGRIAARQGRRADALAISRVLADSVSVLRDRKDIMRLGRWLYSRATIAARLGDREEAVRLLKDARAAGGTVWGPAHFIWMHKDPDLASLRGYPPFEALLAPKD
jgi:hypothetical protein